jgi:hypothetical protein
VSTTVSPSGTARSARRGPRIVYEDDTMTKEVREREARFQTGEDAHIDQSYLVRQRDERQARRVQAGEVSNKPTVSPARRDSHLMGEVERHLFGNSHGRVVDDSMANLNLQFATHLAGYKFYSLYGSTCKNAFDVFVYLLLHGWGICQTTNFSLMTGH